MATKRPSAAARKPARAPNAPAWAAAPANVSAPAASLPRQSPVATDSAPGDAHERIRAAAARGGSLKAMHVLFSVPADAFKRWLDADPSLLKAFDEGVDLERQALHRTIYEAAVLKKDINAAQFLLKHRHNYVQAVAPTKSRVDVNLNARGGILIVPETGDLDTWEARAAAAQAELKEKVRD